MKPAIIEPLHQTIADVLGCAYEIRFFLTNIKKALSPRVKSRGEKVARCFRATPDRKTRIEKLTLWSNIRKVFFYTESLANTGKVRKIAILRRFCDNCKTQISLPTKIKMGLPRNTRQTSHKPPLQ